MGTTLYGYTAETEGHALPENDCGFLRDVLAAVNIPVVAVGLITEPEHAESIVASGDADFIAIARGALYNPRWPWHAAAALGAQVHAPEQYLRCQPHTLKNLFKS